MIPIPTTDPFGALKIGPTVLVAGAATGPLAGCTFVAKDLYDVAGVPTGAGNPDWERTHPTPAATASAVQRVLDGGATLIGKSHTDELAYSLSGTNVHYGTPQNPAAPGRVPGGSSAGSAAAVAGGLCDFALGSDTGGSVRVPASYCGILGIRPTHGRVATDGMVPLAPTFDTVGWFALSGKLLREVGSVMFAASGTGSIVEPRRLVLAVDLLDTLAPDAAELVESAATATAARLHLPLERGVLAGDDIASWADCFRTLQRSEAWACHGEWIAEVGPSFGPGIAQRFADAATVDPVAVRLAKRARVEITSVVARHTEGGTLLVVPATPGPAYPIATSGPLKDAARAGTLALTSPAGLAGVPQVTVHGGAIDGLPIGLGILGAAGSDETLLMVAEALDD